MLTRLFRAFAAISGTSAMASSARLSSAAAVLDPRGASASLPELPPPREVLRARVRGMYTGMMIADALSMPCHWYYNVGDIKKDFGYVKDFVAPLERHPSSIMSLSNTGGAGRGAQSGNVIGDVINHGKRQVRACEG